MVFIIKKSDKTAFNLSLCQGFEKQTLSYFNTDKSDFRIMFYYSDKGISLNLKSADEMNCAYVELLEIVNYLTYGQNIPEFKYFMLFDMRK
jgi:hypothetical protein